jgi:hypothetical protein
MARSCPCPKPRKPRTRAQKAYAAARAQAVSQCLGQSPGPGRAPLQLQPLQRATKRKGTSPKLLGVLKQGSGIFGKLLGSKGGPAVSYSTKDKYGGSYEKSGYGDVFSNLLSAKG